MLKYFMFYCFEGAVLPLFYLFAFHVHCRNCTAHLGGNAISLIASSLKSEALFLFIAAMPCNNVLLIKLEGPVWYTIYHHLPLAFRGKQALLKIINQPMGTWMNLGHL